MKAKRESCNSRLVYAGCSAISSRTRASTRADNEKAARFVGTIARSVNETHVRCFEDIGVISLARGAFIVLLCCFFFVSVLASSHCLKVSPEYSPFFAFAVGVWSAGASENLLLSCLFSERVVFCAETRSPSQQHRRSYSNRLSARPENPRGACLFGDGMIRYKAGALSVTPPASGV